MVLLILALELKAMVSHALDQENINRNTDSWSDFDKYLLFNRYLGKAPLRLQEPMQAVPIVVKGLAGGFEGGRSRGKLLFSSSEARRKDADEDKTAGFARGQQREYIGAIPSATPLLDGRKPGAGEWIVRLQFPLPRINHIFTVGGQDPTHLISSHRTAAALRNGVRPKTPRREEAKVFLRPRREREPEIPSLDDA
eukprot:CAMPEP_0113559784 /NCGR_PEP_ID=MMETSP0015_2-20120614/19081_1 /TAXON_ID=2838 /ORGANISM="Odontella" /LENGTH=195 /DNA_ID=CAMNT_0000461443 /DNA_START=57 /DNA_END=646 /DNA_ORIENTATION=- /assembly_acc=CAM_ASM_000160